MTASADQKGILLKESESRTVRSGHDDIRQPGQRLSPIERLTASAPPISPEGYAYRSFDRQWMLPDARLCNRPRPELQRSHGPQQIYLTSLLTKVLGAGPSAVITELIPDMDHFCGRGGADVIPFYRNAAGTQPNITAGVLSLLSATYGYAVQAPDLMAYVYGLMASPNYVQQFGLELETPGPRVPLTQDGSLFKTVVDLGRELLWLHTADNRMALPGQIPGTLPSGRAKIQVSAQSAQYPESFKYDADTDILHVGETGQFGPVSSAVWAFSVSGLHVVDSWLGYRMQKRSGKSSSDLDTIRPDVWSFDLELLRLLWMLEATLDRMPRATDLLRQVVDGPLFVATQLPLPKPAECKGPEAVLTGSLFDE